ncbi:hypothetical protein [Leifsonia poae]|uniref:Di-and tripeptidase n=1 Tax=Leifsonia poae TaxID=110933 RepID=A0A9W6HD45_9MICO|nr:hypothetical protein [Leifsonia poae]GLJ77573.1 hypothetical protein GCM10017584_31470 [Leifsonia poae]
MAKQQKPIVSVTGGPAKGGDTPRALNNTLDRFLAIQRPVVLAHLRSIRRRHPEADPAALAGILERRYLAAVTTGGAAVGVTAVIPAIGTGVTLALSGLETAGFLEATSLYAQSLSELHGIAVDDPERARALVLTMMLGREGSDLVRQLASQATGAGGTRSTYWGELVTTSLPSMLVGPLVDRLKNAFVRQFAVRGGANLIGRAIPFGIGAVIGGTGNNIVGRRVVQNSRLAFGAAPTSFPPALAPAIVTVRVRPDGSIAARSLNAAVGGARRLGSVAAESTGRAGRAVRGVMPRRRAIERSASADSAGTPAPTTPDDDDERADD